MLLLQQYGIQFKKLWWQEKKVLALLYKAEQKLAADFPIIAKNLHEQSKRKHFLTKLTWEGERLWGESISVEYLCTDYPLNPKLADYLSQNNPLLLKKPFSSNEVIKKSMEYNKKFENLWQRELEPTEREDSLCLAYNDCDEKPYIITALLKTEYDLRAKQFNPFTTEIGLFDNSPCQEN